MPSFSDIQDELYKQYLAIAGEVYTGVVPVLDIRTTQIYASLFNEALEDGYGMRWAKTKPGTLEFERLSRMRANALYFSASKQMRIISDLQTIRESSGSKEYYDAWADSYFNTQNRRWLQAEKEMITANAQMARRWHDIQDSKDVLPNLTYDTVGDARVRPAHQILDGITKPVDDDFWKTHYPPIGYGCRCDVQQNDNPVTKDKNMPDSKQMAFINKAYRFNSGIENRVVGKVHPYLNAVYKKRDIKIGMMEHCTNSENLVSFFENGNKSLKISCFADMSNHTAFIREYNAGIALVNYGKQVVMGASHAFGKKGMFNPDYLIDGKIFDLKTAVANDLNNALTNSFKSAGDQDVENIVLDISACDTDIKQAYKIIRRKILGQTKIKQIIILKDGKPYKL